MLKCPAQHGVQRHLVDGINVEVVVFQHPLAVSVGKATSK